MIKPKKLSVGDTIATISPSWGCAGSARVRWQYELGVQRLRELGLQVVAAPNSLKGTSFLRNIGGNDSVRLLPFLEPEMIC